MYFIFHVVMYFLVTLANLSKYCSEVLLSLASIVRENVANKYIIKFTHVKNDETIDHEQYNGGTQHLFPVVSREEIAELNRYTGIRLRFEL